MYQPTKARYLRVSCNQAADLAVGVGPSQAAQPVALGAM